MFFPANLSASTQNNDCYLCCYVVLPEIQTSNKRVKMLVNDLTLGRLKNAAAADTARTLAVDRVPGLR